MIAISHAPLLCRSCHRFLPRRRTAALVEVAAIAKIKMYAIGPKISVVIGRSSRPGCWAISVRTAIKWTKCERAKDKPSHLRLRIIHLVELVGQSTRQVDAVKEAVNRISEMRAVSRIMSPIDSSLNPCASIAYEMTPVRMAVLLSGSVMSSNLAA